jgi:hypothetical protein
MARVNGVALQKQALLPARGVTTAGNSDAQNWDVHRLHSEPYTGPPSHAESQPRKTKRP